MSITRNRIGRNLSESVDTWWRVGSEWGEALRRDWSLFRFAVNFFNVGFDCIHVWRSILISLLSSIDADRLKVSESLSTSHRLKYYLSTSWIIFGHSWRVIVAGMSRLVMLEAFGYYWNVKHFKYPGNSATQGLSGIPGRSHVLIAKTRYRTSEFMTESIWEALSFRLGLRKE